MTDINRVPPALQEIPGWLLWKFVSKPGEAKPRKIPFWADGTRRHGTQGGPQTAAPATSAGRGSVAGAPRDGSVNITINQNGATPETIRDIAPLIERELGRLGALRR